MFNKLFSKGGSAADGAAPPAHAGSPGGSWTSPNINRINDSAQRSFQRGVQHNLKLLVKGDRGTGKSCLMQRLQGGPFVEEYIPTQAIQVANIQWHYKNADDVIKVEIWDVVDKGRASKPPPAAVGLKTNHGAPAPVVEVPALALDAETVDVFKGANGVVLLYDITKRWTFEYAEREIDKIPQRLPILLLANVRDREKHRVVAIEEGIKLAASFHGLRAPVVYAESSMVDGFGLKFIYRFLNIPFQAMVRENIEKQLVVCEQEMQACLDELEITRDTTDQDYAKFLEMLEEAKKRKPSKAAIVESPIVPPQPLQESDVDKKKKEEPKKEEAKQEAKKEEPKKEVKKEEPKKEEPKKKEPEKKMSAKEVKAAAAKAQAEAQASLAALKAAASKPGSAKLASVDEFRPDDDGLDGFLGDEPAPTPPPKPQAQKAKAADSDDEGGNPLVEQDANDFGGDSEEEAEDPAPKLSTSQKLLAMMTGGRKATPPPAKQPAKPAEAPKPVEAPKEDSDSDDDAPNSLVAADEDLDEPPPSRAPVQPPPKAAPAPAPAPIQQQQVKTVTSPTTTTTKAPAPRQPVQEDSDDDDGPNPHVMGDDDLESDDDVPARPPPAKSAPSRSTSSSTSVSSSRSSPTIASAPPKAPAKQPSPPPEKDEGSEEDEEDLDSFLSNEPAKKPSASSSSSSSNRRDESSSRSERSSRHRSDRDREDRDRSSRHRDDDGDGHRSSDRHRDSERSRDSDRRRDGDRRESDRHRDRDSERNRDRESDRDRNRDRDGDRDRHRERDRERDSDRPRSSHGSSSRSSSSQAVAETSSKPAEKKPALKI